MTAEESAGGRGRETGEGSADRIEGGRYLYCVVRVGDEAAFSTTGIEGTTDLVVAGDLGAVVHACESLYDSDDPERVRRWLLRHQAVVDDATERFGTPLPVRFDTVLRGGDEGVRAWLEDRRESLSSALDSLAGRREYRIAARWDDERLDEAIEGDERLADLAARRAEASEGTAFLLDKQYDERRRELKRAHLDRRAAELSESLSEVATEVRELGRPKASAAVLSEDAGGDADDSRTEGAGAADGRRIRLAVLAPPEAEGRIGSVLDEIGDDPAVEVRFTGPWPPYTFAPDLDGSGGR